LSDPCDLEVRLIRQVHPGLRLDVELDLGRECGVVFGPSGAGKSTLLKLIAGLEPADSGHVRLAGTVLFDASAGINLPLRRRRIGMIFQDDLLFPHLNAEANIRFGLKGWTRSEAERRLAEVITLCGVERLLDRFPAALSGGERQRVGLARALAPRPRLLLCDEPVSALDLASRQSLLEHLRAVPLVESIPVLYVTHSPAEAIELGRRLFLLVEGRIVQQGPPLEILATPAPGTPEKLEGIRNVFAAVVEDHEPGSAETHLQLLGGPTLVVPLLDRPPRTRVSVVVRADDVILARAPVQGLSARNVIAGMVEQVVRHGPDVEVLVRTGDVRWIVSVVAPAAESLGVAPGVELYLIIKARSCRILEAGPAASALQDD
jgi:molybdate transport system ATP-binding protein